jgi:putative oxidoreductase
VQQNILRNKTSSCPLSTVQAGNTPRFKCASDLEGKTERKEKHMKKIFSWLNHPPTLGPESTLFLRVMAGGVFLWEGILKFVYVNQGVGRFTKLGMPFPHFTADSVALLEIVGGLLLISGFLTRWISIPFIIEMIVAMLSTKVSLYLGTSPLPLPPAPPRIGIWAVLHEVRSEYAQALVVAFLLINGPGKWSLDALFRRSAPRDHAHLAGADARLQEESVAMI